MIAIISRVDENGNFPEVGTNNRVLVKHYKTFKGIENFARKFAGGKKHKIELFQNKIYAEPTDIIIVHGS